MCKILKTEMSNLQDELHEAELAFTWNIKLFELFGMNPLNFNNIIYAAIVIYASLQFVLSIANLADSMYSISHLLDTFTEIMAIFTTLTKFIVYKLNQRELAELLRDVAKDYRLERYKSEQEVYDMSRYMNVAKVFSKITCSFAFVAGWIYFIRIGFFEGLGIPVYTDLANLTVMRLPYSIKFFCPVTNMKIYALGVIYLLPLAPIASFGVIADGSLLVALVAHVCGQLSILARHRFQRFGHDVHEFRNLVADAILLHYRIQSLAKKINAAFSFIIFEERMSAIIIICFLLYASIMNLSQQNNTAMLCAISVVFSQTMIIFEYSYIGQRLIDESLYLNDALCAAPWYTLGTKNMKYYLILLVQAQQPLCLRAGKFYVYSLDSFVTILKSAMAYLSVLRAVA